MVASCIKFNPSLPATRYIKNWKRDFTVYYRAAFPSFCFCFCWKPSTFLTLLSGLALTGKLIVDSYVTMHVKVKDIWHADFSWTRFILVHQRKFKVFETTWSSTLLCLQVPFISGLHSSTLFVPFGSEVQIFDKNYCANKEFVVRSVINQLMIKTSTTNML